MNCAMGMLLLNLHIINSLMVFNLYLCCWSNYQPICIKIVSISLSVQCSIPIVFHALHVAVVDFQALFLLALMLHCPVVSWVHTSHITTQSFITMSPFVSYSGIPSGHSLLLSKLLIIWLAYCPFFLKVQFKVTS